MSDADGLATVQSVTIGGTTVAIGSLNTSSFIGAHGTLLITSYDAATGIAHYQYTLTSPTTDGPGIESETFSLTVSDGTASSAPAAIVIDIVDDVPNAVNDTDSFGTGTTGTSIGGNVVDGTGTTSGAAGADVQGADGASVSHIQSNNIGGAGVDVGGSTMINGQYGTLTLHENGEYTYVRNSGSAGSDVFTYTLKDGDGDTSTAKLTIDLDVTGPADCRLQRERRWLGAGSGPHGRCDDDDDRINQRRGW